MRPFISSIILLILLCLPCAGWAKTLKVLTLHTPPLAYEKNGQIVGITAELVREGLKRMGYEADISLTPWKRALHMTRWGDADAIFQATWSLERDMWFHYPTTPLFSIKAVFVKRRDNHVQIFPDKFEYPKQVLGTVRGGFFGPKLSEFLSKAQFKRVDQLSTTAPNFDKLIERRIDLYVTTYSSAKAIIREKGMSDALDFVLDDNGQPFTFEKADTFLAFSKHNFPPSIAEEFSNTLDNMMKDGTYNTIMKKYLEP